MGILKKKNYWLENFCIKNYFSKDYHQFQETWWLNKQNGWLQTCQVHLGWTEICQVSIHSYSNWKTETKKLYKAHCTAYWSKYSKTSFVTPEYCNSIRGCSQMMLSTSYFFGGGGVFGSPWPFVMQNYFFSNPQSSLHKHLHFASSQNSNLKQQIIKTFVNILSL